MSIEKNSGSKRKVMEGVPKVAFAPIHDGKWEHTPFPSCLKACLTYLDQKYPYHYILSTSGAAFRLVWHSKRWEGGNVDIVFMNKNPLKPFYRAFESVGRSMEIFLNQDHSWHITLDEEHMKDHRVGKDVIKRKIIESINNNIPVIGFGVVGPPEASIITGYDNHGETLIGWSLFQNHLDPTHNINKQEEEMYPPTGIEPSGYFRQDDWFRKTTGIVTIGEKTEVNESDVYRKTLEWIVEIIKTPMINEFYTGLRAYDAYIEKLQTDAEFPAENMTVLAERKMVHYDAMTMIYERGGGASFLKDVALHKDFKNVEKELNEAARLFQDTSNQMEKWWQIVGQIWDNEEKQVKVMEDPKVRTAFVPAIETCRKNDEEAVTQIEIALKNLV